MYRFILIFLFSICFKLEANEPVMLVKGKLLAEETFGRGEKLESRESAEDAVMSNGPLKWVSEEGGTKATLKSTLQKEEGATLGNHILECTFRYEEELDRTQIVYNDEFGHAIIIQLSPEYHHVRKWPDQDLLHRFEEFPDASGSSLKPGELYTVTVEMCDSEFLIRINDNDFLFGENYRAGRAKHRIAVSVEGGQSTLQSIRLWEGTPLSDWTKNREAWVARQQDRLSWEKEASEDFKSRFRVAALRRQLRDNGDPGYAAIVKETSAYLEEIRSLYPFYGAKPTRKNVLAKKDARLHDERYRSMLKHLAQLEEKELTYFQTLDSTLFDLKNVKKR